MEEKRGGGFEGCKKRRSLPIKRTRMQLLPHTLAKALKGRQRDMNLKTKVSHSIAQTVFYKTILHSLISDNHKRRELVVLWIFPCIGSEGQR